MTAGFSKSEILWTTYADRSGNPVFAVTSNLSRSVYYLYDMSKSEPVRLGKGKTPKELESKFHVTERMLQP